VTGPRAAAALAVVLAAVALSASLGACSAMRTQPSRRQWLQQQLLQQHAGELARDPRAVAEKLQRMARTSFSYFRGSAGLLPREPTRFATPETAAVALVGDPHPENIGTFRSPRGERAVDWNDFDLAGPGSYVDDLRRLALGLWLVGDMADIARKQRARLVEEVLDGYQLEIRRLARAEPPVALRVETAFGGDLEPLLARADTLDGDDDAGHPGGRVSDQQRAALAQALLDYRASLLAPAAVAPGALAIKQAARVNAGIASYALARYRVRVEGPGPGDGDDWTLELKELPGGRPAAPLVRLQRQLQEAPDLDPLLGWTRFEGREMRVRQLGPDHRRVSADRIVQAVKSPRWGKKDLRLLAHDSGRLLARAHARAPRQDAGGQPGLAAIAAALGDGRGLSYETVAVTARAAATVEHDLDDLRALLAQHGPLLGARVDPSAGPASGPLQK
jgi:hypothetical protein